LSRSYNVQIIFYLLAWIFFFNLTGYSSLILRHCTPCHFALFLLSRILLANIYCLSFWGMLLLVLEWPISMNHLVNPFWDLWLYVFKTWHVRNFLGIMIHFSLCQKLKRGFIHHECLDGTFLYAFFAFFVLMPFLLLLLYHLC